VQKPVEMARFSKDYKSAIAAATAAYHFREHLPDQYGSFHNLGDLTAFKKGPNQGRAFRHSL
jgi:hypothetical protein